MTAAGGLQPYGWQTVVALDWLPGVLPIPTGLEKTEVVLSWAWHWFIAEVVERLHLIYCLPMRSLMTQTKKCLTDYFQRVAPMGIGADWRARAQPGKCVTWGLSATMEGQP